MILKQANELKFKPVVRPDVHNVRMAVAIGKDEGAPSFTMRIFELGSKGHTPSHSHDWEHEIYVISGQGEVVKKDGVSKLLPGHTLLVKPGTEHQFRNSGTVPFQFICIVPHRGHK